MASGAALQERFTTRTDGGTVFASGHLDRRAADSLLDTVTALRHDGAENIVLDLGGVSGVDGHGVRVLAALQHTLATHSGQLVLRNAGPRVAAALLAGQLAFQPRPRVRDRSLPDTADS